MKPAVFWDSVKRETFFFPNGDRSMFTDIRCGQELELAVKDRADRLVSIRFCVTRDAHLGSFHRRIYGKVLGLPEDEYRQIEIHLRSNDPEQDTIGVCLQAPPIGIR